ncbi:unnamed protein product [Staurois parvus]|uniref:Uncharacterized protein n=1 Tax=Staurois parvus TaxID=386267 RepID=A0ABN9DPI7_9NEOB|nr:unnamed protein product [Staurois parvus]
MIGAQKCHPPVPPTCAQQCTLLYPAVHPPVPPSSATHLCPEVPPTCAQQCHTPVPTHLCPPVPPTCVHHQCHLSVLSISGTCQCLLSVTPH